MAGGPGWASASGESSATPALSIDLADFGPFPNTTHDSAPAVQAWLARVQSALMTGAGRVKATAPPGRLYLKSPCPTGLMTMAISAAALPASGVAVVNGSGVDLQIEVFCSSGTTAGTWSVNGGAPAVLNLSVNPALPAVTVFTVPAGGSRTVTYAGTKPLVRATPALLPTAGFTQSFANTNAFDVLAYCTGGGAYPTTIQVTYPDGVGQTNQVVQAGSSSLVPIPAGATGTAVTDPGGAASWIWYPDVFVDFDLPGVTFSLSEGFAPPFSGQLPGRYFGATCDAESIIVSAGSFAGHFMAAPILRFDVEEWMGVNVGTTNADTWSGVFWDEDQVYAIKDVFETKCRWLGPSNTEADGYAVSFVEHWSGKDCEWFGLERTPNFFSVKSSITLIGGRAGGFNPTESGAGGVVIGSPNNTGLSVVLKGFRHDSSARMLFQAPIVKAERCVLQGGILVNYGSTGTADDYDFDGCDIGTPAITVPAVTIIGPMLTGFRMRGGSLQTDAAELVLDQGPNGSSEPWMAFEHVVAKPGAGCSATYAGINGTVSWAGEELGCDFGSLTPALGHLNLTDFLTMKTTGGRLSIGALTLGGVAIATPDGNTGHFLRGDGAFAAPPGTADIMAKAQPADPAGTTSTSGVMQGLGITYTPSGSGVLLLLVTGVGWSTAGPAGIAVRGYYAASGTAGWPPGNGVSLPAGSSQFGLTKNFRPSATGNQGGATFVLLDVLALTPGQQYDFDLWLATNNAADQANLREIGLGIVEVG